MMSNKRIGTFLYYLAWPLIWFYGPLNIRVRVIIKHKSEVLLVKNWFGPNKQHLPGGGKKFNEKPIDTAIREVKEELNIEIQNKSKLVSDEVYIVKANGILYRFMYVISEFGEKPRVEPNKEISDYTWEKLETFTLPDNLRRHL